MNNSRGGRKFSLGKRSHTRAHAVADFLSGASDSNLEPFEYFFFKQISNVFGARVFKLLASFPSFSAGDSLEMTEQDYRPVTETNARHTNRETNSNKKIHRAT